RGYDKGSHVDLPPRKELGYCPSCGSRQALTRNALYQSCARTWAQRWLIRRRPRHYHELGQYRTRLPAEAAYLLSQRGHDAVSFSFRTSFILAPKKGKRTYCEQRTNRVHCFFRWPFVVGSPNPVL